MLVYLIYLIIFSLPLYLLRLKILWAPTTVLELMIGILFIVWLIKLKIKSQKLKVAVQNSKLSDRRSKLLTFNCNFGLWTLGFGLPILLLLIGCIISTVVSPAKWTSLGILKGWFVGPLLFFIVLVSTIKTKKQVRNILTCFSLSGAAVGVIGLAYLFASNLTFDGRLRAIFSSPNHLAMYLAPALLIAFYLLFTSKKLKARALHTIPLLAICSVISVALYFTFSYGAWMGVISGFMFLFWFFAKHSFGRKERKILLFYYFIVLLFIIILVVSQLGSEKSQSFLYSTRSSFQSRLTIWRVGLSVLKDHSLWGIGLGTFQEYYLDYRSYFKEPYLEWAVPQPHNLFLAFWLQTGILGLIGFIWIITGFFKMGLKLCRESDSLHLSLIAVMICILVHGLVDTTYWKNDLAVVFWVIVGLMVALSRLKKNL